MLTAALFLFKLFFNSGNFLFNIINETLVLLTAVFLILYLTELIRSRKINPMSIVMSVGILNAVIFFMLAFSSTIMNAIFDNLKEAITKPGLLYNIISFVYSYIIMVSLSIIFIFFKELFFLRQKRNVSTYYNTMIVFFILASFSSIFSKIPDISFIKNTFYIIAILLIFVNSIKISWIAFIVKREKITLLVLSIIIGFLFTVNLINGADAASGENVLAGFSSSLNTFLNLLMIYGVIYFGILFFTTLFHIPTAEAFDRKAQEISSLQYFSSLINQVLDFKDLAETIADISVKITNSNASFIIWKENGNWKTIVNKNIGFIDSDILTKFLLGDDYQNSYTTTTIVKINDANIKVELSENYSITAISPLKTYNEIVGYLITAKKDDYIFDEEDKNALNTFSYYASTAVENSALLKESIEKERLEKELDLAREIQRKLVPVKNPEYEKLNISSVFIPAFEVGGDYYDFFEISENKLGFVIADVSGKGISAAFIMAEIKGIFESLSKTSNDPKDILTKANQILERTLDRKNFVSAAYGIFDFENEVLRISRAGHCPVILIRDNVSENIRPKGFGLGMNFSNYFEETLEEIVINLRENDLLVLYTDGITEAKNKEMEDFGDELFEKILLENCNKNVDEISNKVIHELTLFSQNNSQHDDITLVILKWKENLKFDGEKEWQNSAPQLQNKVK